MSLLRMVQGLTEAGVRYVAIGGVAGTAHGSSRVTDDLDICFEASPGNRTRLAGLLAGWSAYPRGIDRGLPFIMDARTLRDAEVLTLITSEGPIDLFQRVPGVGSYADCWARSTSVGAGDIHFRALDLPALIAAKRAAGRPRDMEHLRELEALLELRREPGDGNGDA